MLVSYAALLIYTLFLYDRRRQNSEGARIARGARRLRGSRRALRDESMKLRAEEEIKRLSDDVETVAVRRKVGGLPSHLTIFELGFAGKGRIYYPPGRQRRYRVLSIGAKNSQETDREYLSRLPRE